MFKSYLPYISVFVLLLIAGIIMINRNNGTLKQNMTDFIPAKMNRVDRVVIKGGNRHIILRKTQDTWELDSLGKARPNVVDIFFTGLNRLEIIAPASVTDRAGISQYLLDHGKQVSFYHHGKRMRSFTIGHDSLANPGTYIMDARQKFPYRVKLKGFAETNLENLFSLDADIWRQ